MKEQFLLIALRLARINQKILHSHTTQKQNYELYNFYTEQ